MGQTIQTLTVDIATIGAGTDEEREIAPPWAGEWRLIAAQLVPATTVAANGTDYVTVSLKQGSTTLGSLATSAVDSTKGTPRAFTLSGGAALEFTGGTDCIEIATVNSGAGAAFDGSLSFAFEKLNGS